MTADELEQMEAELAAGQWLSRADSRALIDEVRRLQALAGDFFADLAYMDEHLFCKHHWSDLEENPWLEKFNPFPEGSPYFPETQGKREEEGRCETS